MSTPTRSILPFQAGPNVPGSGNPVWTYQGWSVVTDAEIAWSAQNANLVYAGPVSGSPAVPTFRALVPIDYPLVTITDRGATPTLPNDATKFLNGIGTWTVPSSGGTPGGADTQVQFNDAGAFGGSSLFTFVKATGATVLSPATTTSGGFSGFTANTISTSSTNSSATLTGAIISATANSSHTFTAAAPGGVIGGNFQASSSGSGTVTAESALVALVGSGPGSSVTNGYGLYVMSPSAFTSTMGTATGIFIDAQAVVGVGAGVGINQAGSSDTNTFAGATTLSNTVTLSGLTLTRPLALDASKNIISPTVALFATAALSSGGGTTTFYRADGTWAVPPGTGGSGTVTSVGLSLPSFITVTVSPVTGSGTLTGVLANQSANLMFAGPSSGAAAAPTFRASVPLDWAAAAATGGIAYTSSPTANAWIVAGAQNTILMMGASVPTWSAYTLPASVTTGDLWYGSASNVVTALAKGTTGKILQAGASIPGYSAFTMANPGTSGNVLTSDGTNWTSSAANTLPTASTLGRLLYDSGSAWTASTAAIANGVIFASSGQIPLTKAGFTFDGTSVFTVTGDGVAPAVFSTGYAVAPGIFTRRASGSLASPTNVALNDIIGNFVNGAYINGGFSNVAEIRVSAAGGTVSNTSCPTSIGFMTTPDGSLTRAVRWTILSGGGLINSNASLAVGDLRGYFNPGAVAGKPTGTPVEGAGSLRPNSSQGNLWMWDGTRWNNQKGGYPASYSGASNTGGTENLAEVTSGSGGPVGFTLPSPSGRDGEIYTVTKIDAGISLVSITGGTALASVTMTLTNQYSTKSFKSDGSIWLLISVI